MKVRNTSAVLTILLLAGCASHEGKYSPNCVAYAGSTVSLDGETFVWDRFTDQVRVDDNGNIIDGFPDYPKRGSYRIDGQTVYMESDSGQSMDNMYLHQSDATYLLLTAEENMSWQQTGEYGDCVLTLGYANNK